MDTIVAKGRKAPEVRHIRGSVENMATKLTATTVRALTKTPGKYGDGDGLWLHVTKPGQAHWYLHYGGRARQRQMSLGNAELVTLAEARERALEARKQLAHGVDPLDQREQAKAAAKAEKAKGVTFREVVDDYIEANEAGWHNPKHRYQWRATLDHACGIIGDVPVSAIDTAHVLKVLTPIWTAKPETASRLRGRMEMVLSYAAVSGSRDRNTINPAMWRGHLQLILPSKRKLHKVKHLAALPWQEAPAFMRELRARESFSARALEFAILTAARSGEVRGATWPEIDLDAAMWTIPAERMKGGAVHRVPLSAPAVAILREMAKLQDGSGLVFLGIKKGVPLSDMTLTAVLRRMGRTDITTHGFRSTFRDWTEDATAYPNHVAEQALAHAIPSAVEAAYRRSDLFEKRKALMDDWAAYLAKPPAQVVRPKFGQRRAGAARQAQRVAPSGVAE